MNRTFLCIVAAIIMVCVLTACGNRTPMETTTPAETTPVENTTPAENTPVENTPEYTAKDWQYYVTVTKDCDSRTMGEFYAAMNQLYSGKLQVFEDFLDNPVISEEFISELKETNVHHQKMEDIYYDTRAGKHTDVSVREFLDMEYYYGDGDGWEPPAMIEIQYSSTWNASQYYSKYLDGNWNTDFSKRYADGLFELSDDYWCWVVWTQNIVTPEGQDDGNEGEHRLYKVENPSVDAYILVEGLETGYQMIRIIAE